MVSGDKINVHISGSLSEGYSAAPQWYNRIVVACLLRLMLEPAYGDPSAGTGNSFPS